MIAPSLILFLVFWALLSLSCEGFIAAQCFLLRKDRDVLFPRKRLIVKPKRKL